MNIQKAIQIYLDWKQTHTTSAYEAYKNRLLQFLHFIEPKMCLQDISGDDVVAFHKNMQTQYSPATIAYSCRILKNFFTFWQGRKQINFSSKEIIPVRYCSPTKEVVTQEDFNKMDTLLRDDILSDLQKKLTLHLLWDTGVRVSELLDIELANINPPNPQGLRTAKIRTRKSMRYNLIAWSTQTDELLLKYLGIRLCMETPSDKLLINPKTNKGFTAKSIQRWIKELSQEAEIEKNITPHSFRHGKAHYILDQGGSMRDVTAILRHVNPHTSYHYMQLSMNRYQEVAGKYLENKPKYILLNNSIPQSIATHG